MPTDFPIHDEPLPLVYLDGPEFLKDTFVWRDRESFKRLFHQRLMVRALAACPQELAPKIVDGLLERMCGVLQDNAEPDDAIVIRLQLGDGTFENTTISRYIVAKFDINTKQFRVQSEDWSES
jgi:hypothetical protein